MRHKKLEQKFEEIKKNGESLTKETKALIRYYGFNLKREWDFHYHHVVSLEDDFEIRFFKERKVLVCTDVANAGKMLGLAKALIVLKGYYAESEYPDIVFTFSNSFSEKEEDVNGRKALPSKVIEYIEKYDKLPD